MANIRKRKNKDGSIAYTVQIRIKRSGQMVHQESRTFSPTKYDNPARASALWAKQREVELERTEPWLQAEGAGMTLPEAFRRYVAELEASPAGIGKTKKSALLGMAGEPMLQDVAVTKADSALLTDYLRYRTSGDQGVAPATALQDLIYYRLMLDYARVAWGLPLELQYVDDVRKVLGRMGVVGKSEARDRRPQLDELDRLMQYFHRPRAQGGHRFKMEMPAHLLVLFLLFSTRRLSEMTRLEWADLDDDQNILVRDMKHPRAKMGNHKRVHIPDRAMAIIKQMPKVKGEPLIFPFKPRSVARNFERACEHRISSIEDLRLHDLRHEGVSHLFELGWDIPRVALVSGHSNWDSLKRYTHLHKPEPHDKYAGWGWLEKLGIK
ncbi:MAG: site-specific integrase [Marinobacterium sp.]|nr:site-specific integrase [Marinobacterium sp.]